MSFPTVGGTVEVCLCCSLLCFISCFCFESYGVVAYVNPSAESMNGQQLDHINIDLYHELKQVKQ